MNFGIFSFLFCICYAGMVKGIETYYMDQLCGSTLDLTSPRQIYAIRLLLSKNSYYTTDLNCIVHVYAERNEKLLLYFKTMDIYSDCSNTWLELHDGYSVKDHYVPGLHGKQCGSMKLWKEYHTNRNELTLYFTSARNSHYNNFDIITTRYHNGHCNDEEYRCGKGWCINNSLKCNSYNPCGAESDCPLAAGSVVAIVIGCVAFLIIVLVCVVFVRRRRPQYTERIVTIETPPPTYGTPGESYNQPIPQQYPPVTPVSHQGGYEAVPSAPPPPYPKIGRAHV